VAVTLAVVGDADDLRVAGPGGGGEPGDADVVLTLDGKERPAGARVWIDWRSGEPPSRSDAPDRVVAPHGDGLWRRAPWPVNDALFSLPLPAEADSIALVLGEPGEERDAWAGAVGEHLRVEADERLTVPQLERAGIVALPGRRLPGAAFAALAAGRLVIAGELEPSFGLLAQVEHIAVTSAGAAGQVAGMALDHPSAFAQVANMGPLAAERHRASVVYSRLSTDLGVERNSRSAVSS
jgi:hypothetical protein